MPPPAVALQVATALVGGYAVYEQQQAQEHNAAPLKATEFDTEEQLRINRGVKAQLLPVPEPPQKSR